MPRKMVKVICIILAALMALSAIVVITQVFAIDESTVMTAVPNTGENEMDVILPAGLAVAAVLAVVLCIVIPKLKKKQ